MASLAELESLSFLGESIAFWASRLRRQACPRCKAVGTLGIYAYAYALFVYCARRTCEYEVEHAYFGKNTL